MLVLGSREWDAIGGWGQGMWDGWSGRRTASKQIMHMMIRIRTGADWMESLGRDVDDARGLDSSMKC